MFEIDYEAIRKLRYKRLFHITLEKISMDIKKLFERYAMDYVEDMSAVLLEGDEEQGSLGGIDLASKDQKSRLHMRLGQDSIIIESISLKHGISKEFLDALIPCIMKCACRLTRYHEFVLENVEDEVMKKWCMDHGYEEIVRKLEAYGGEESYYRYVLHISNETYQVPDTIDSISTRREIYQALMSSKAIELKERLEECACSYLLMESSLGGGEGQDHVVGDLTYSSYDASTDIKIRFYTDRIVIHRFEFNKGNLRKCLDECIDQIVELANYFVDIHEIVFHDVESDSIRNWCLGNGYQADDTNHDIRLNLTDDPVEGQLHSTEVRFLAASLSTFMNVSDYNLTFYALNHEIEEDISAGELMDKLISCRGRGTYSKHEYWRVEADREEVRQNEFCYDMINLYKDGRRINKVAEVYNTNGVLWVKLNIDLDMIWILPEGVVRSIDIVDKNNNYLLRISSNEMVDGRYIGSVTFDFRKNILYNEKDNCKVYKWEVVS